MGEDEIRIDQAPRRWRLGDKTIYNAGNTFEVQLPLDHPLCGVIETLLLRLIPLFGSEATAEQQQHAQDLCNLLQQEIDTLPEEAKLEAIVATLTAHWHDPEWARVINAFAALEDERYTIKEIHRGRFIADWQGNHVDAKCEIRQARKPFRQTNAQLAAHSTHGTRKLLAALPRGLITLPARSSRSGFLQDQSPTLSRIEAIPKASS